MSPTDKKTSDASAKPNERTNARSGGNEAQKPEGPARMSPELDRKGGWEQASSEPGYQKGDQGGYRGGYDEEKFEETARKHFPPAEGDHPSPGASAPTKTPADQNVASPSRGAQDHPKKK
jgi:hypothetical protein